MNTKIVRFPSSLAFSIGRLPVNIPRSDDDTRDVLDLCALAVRVRDRMRTLEQDPLVRLAIASVVADCRGGKSGTLILDEDGQLAVEVNCGRLVESKPEPEPESKPESKLTRGPSLDDLRAEAAALNVDISDLGRKKGLILARLDAARNAPPPSPPASSEDDLLMI